MIQLDNTRCTVARVKEHPAVQSRHGTDCGPTMSLYVLLLFIFWRSKQKISTIVCLIFHQTWLLQFKQSRSIKMTLSWSMVPTFMPDMFSQMFRGITLSAEGVLTLTELQTLVKDPIFKSVFRSTPGIRLGSVATIATITSPGKRDEMQVAGEHTSALVWYGTVLKRQIWEAKGCTIANSQSGKHPSIRGVKLRNAHPATVLACPHATSGRVCHGNVTPRLPSTWQSGKRNGV